MDYSAVTSDSSNELYHYGRLGMKWYQHIYGDEDPRAKYNGKSLKVTNKALKEKNAGAAPLKYRSPFSYELAELGKQAVLDFATLVPGLNMAVLARNIYTINKYRADGKDYTTKDGDYYKSVKDFKKQTSKLSPAEDSDRVNPHRNKRGALNNCGYCTTTYELRRRGYDVQARRKGSGIVMDQFKNWFDGVEFHNVKPEIDKKASRKEKNTAAYNQLCSELEKNPNGSRGFIHVQWDPKIANGAHVFNWEIENGQAVFHDGQVKNANINRSFSLAKYDSLMWGRLDNTKLKDGVTECCINYGEETKKK